MVDDVHTRIDIVCVLTLSKKIIHKEKKKQVFNEYHVEQMYIDGIYLLYLVTGFT